MVRIHYLLPHQPTYIGVPDKDCSVELHPDIKIVNLGVRLSVLLQEQ